MPLMQALMNRHSTREFSSQKLSPQVLSNLLWAAFGINRPGEGKRTAPSAMNWQEIDIYVATADGLYVYDAKGNKLDPVLAEDVRGATGTQAFVKDAAANLVYVADLAKTGRASSSDRDTYVAADVGFIAQNVYLFCASEGLAVVVRGSVDRASLAKVMKLRPDQRILLAQTVGYPKK
jgi:SagB-type dehydrogenase family enzyme